MVLRFFPLKKWCKIHFWCKIHLNRFKAFHLSKAFHLLHTFRESLNPGMSPAFVYVKKWFDIFCNQSLFFTNRSAFLCVVFARFCNQSLFFYESFCLFMCCFYVLFLCVVFTAKMSSITISTKNVVNIGRDENEKVKENGNDNKNNDEVCLFISFIYCCPIVFSLFTIVFCVFFLFFI